MTRNLVGASLENIEDLMKAMEELPYHARQVYAGLYGRLLRSWDSFTDLGKNLRDKLKEKYTIEYTPIRQVFVSKDGTRRYLFELSSGRLTFSSHFK